MPCSLSHQAAPPVTVQGTVAAVALLSHVFPQTLRSSGPFSSLYQVRAKLRSLRPPRPAIKDLDNLPTVRRLFSKDDVAAAHLNTSAGSLFSPSLLSSGFLQNVRTNLGSSVHRRKGRALKTAASGGCRYPDQGERRSIICHCLLYPPSLPYKVEWGGGGG